MLVSKAFVASIANERRTYEDICIKGSVKRTSIPQLCESHKSREELIAHNL
jgi:hypothetical protein